MGRIGKISSIKKNYPTGYETLESSLSAKGYDRFPGTYTMFLPYKELSGKYRTGLDPDALFLERIASKEERDLKKKMLREDLNRLQEATGLDLSPRSSYYNFGARPEEKGGDIVKVKAIKIYQKDNIFNLDNPLMEISYKWLSVHPQIASSYRAYEKGLYPSSTQFFVNNEDVEQELLYSKKTVINKAIVSLDLLSIEKRKKVARLLELPVADHTSESMVYNLLDTFIKGPEVKAGPFKGQDPVELFKKFADMDAQLLSVKDIVEQAITNSIYRIKAGGRIAEGEAEIFKSKDELVEYLYSDKGQEDYIALQDKLLAKKSTLVQ